MRVIPDSRFPIPRFPIPDSRFPIPDSRFPIPDSRFPILGDLCNLQLIPGFTVSIPRPQI